MAMHSEIVFDGSELGTPMHDAYGSLSQYRSGEVDANGGKLKYRYYPASVSGAYSVVDENHMVKPGMEPIVLIPGWGCTMTDWFCLPEQLAAIGRDVVLFDPRGIGESSSHNGKISVEDIAADTISLADQLLPRGPFVAVGYSAGAFVVQHLAIYTPERVAAAVIVGGQGDRKTAVNGAAEFFKVARASFPDNKDQQSREKTLSYMVSTKELEASSLSFNDVVLRNLAETRPKATINAQLKMLATADFGPQLSSIHCPVLVLHGQDDVVVPVQNGYQLFKDLTGCQVKRMKVLPGKHACFSPNQAKAMVFAQALKQFLDECDGALPQSKL